MKRFSYVLGVFFCLICSLTISAGAASLSAIDVSDASEGSFQVYYEEATTSRMKVGVTFNGKTTYYNYTAGSEASYAFTEGNGSYTITLYRQLSGTSYTAVERSTVSVAMSDPMAPYLASTAEITFADGDTVSEKAASLCAGLETTEDKLVALHNFIAQSFTYDFDFAAQVNAGSVKNYTPSTAATLASGKGVCYDLSALFAAMCRSQDIPCALAKGQMFGGYHAWNLANVNGEWVALDLTASVAGHTTGASLSQCAAGAAGYYAVEF